ncbi:MAG: MqnA/MqnD/SBP family protein [Candidatus Poribacteria bacterium]|nr:MqnA/MqnD/SBP family protein [Candidatus Poribacteria bacterium]
MHVIEDIESLNKRALNSELEVTAISIHAYAYVSKDYALMPCGASIGDRYGPIVVSTSPIDLHDLSGKRIAIPGEMTTAYLTLQLFEPDFIPEVVPFDQILDHVKQGKSDAGLIIHEGQLTYQSQGFHKIIDLGEWWHQETDLPLPLGANVIRRDLGSETIRKITALLKQSIQYSLSHRQEGLEYAMVYARDMESDSTLADRFVGMYVNDYTLDYGQRGRAGVHELLSRGYQSGIIKSPVEIDFVEL